MFSVREKTVLVTGASAGIGEACSVLFAREGARIIICARRKDRIEALAGRLRSEYGADVLPLVLDVSDRKAVGTTVGSLKPEWKKIDVLINNAGIGLGLEKLHEYDLSDCEDMIDTNVKGLLYVSRAVIPGMVSRGFGHVINLGSIAGHQVYPGGSIYCATKHAVTAMTRGLQIDLVDTPLRVSTVDPGMVETDFSRIRFKGDSERAKKVYEGITPLTADDIAEAVLFCATRPPHMNISEMVVMPTNQASANIAYRET